MEWIPVFLVTFKALVFIGMLLAIKWHYDQEKALKAHARLNAAQQKPAATTTPNAGP